MSKNQTMTRIAQELVTQVGDLASVPQELLNSLNIAQSTRLYKKGQILFYEGNRPFGLFYLNTGKVKLYKYTPEGKVYITQIVAAGELLGCHAFFTDEAYSVTAEVLEDATACFIEKDVVKEILVQDPHFSTSLLSKMARELRNAEVKAADIAYKSVQERMVALMVSLEKQFGVPADNGSVLLDISLSREEIASMIGSTIETAVRVLSGLKEKKIIQSSGRSAITILNHQALATLSF